MFKRVNPEPSITHLFISFLRLGATAFGGPSMVAYIHKMAVEQKRWLDEKTFRDGIALCQMIPGATSMQAAAYVGLKTRGVIGAVASFMGFGLPAFFIMAILSAIYARVHTLSAVVSTFNGLQAIVVAIVANATVLFRRTSLKSNKHITITGVAATMFGLSANPIAVIALAALLGFALIKDGLPYNTTTVGMARTPHSAKPFLLLLAVVAIGFILLFFVHRTLFDLAILMFKIDLFAFGGGFASVPLMFHEIVEVRAWMDSSALLNGIVLGQVTPGSIVITATFIGYLLHGFIGGLIATISVFSPSFMMVIGSVPYFDRLRILPYFNKIICGILCSFVGLLLTVTFRFAWHVHWDFIRIILASAAFAGLILKADILWVVVIGTIISVVAAI